MSLRASRRSWIAALTVGASLAVASSASAIPVPIGSSSDTPYSGSGKPTSVYSLYKASGNALLLAENLIYATGIDSTHFTKAFTAYTDLTSTNVPEIATDFAVTASSNQTNFYKLDTAWCETPTSQGGAGQSSAVCTSGTGGVPPASVTATFTGTVQPAVASAAASWSQLAALINFLGSASGTMYSADSASVSSSGTVVSTQDPIAYDIKVSAPSGGYVVPGIGSTQAFSLTFPAGLSVNTALVADEVNAAANGTTSTAIAAVEANPSGTSIGTVTATSPLANEFGGTNNQLVGKIYVVTTGASSGQGSATQPYLELWFGNGLYELGAFPSSLSFPLQLTFGEITVPGLGQEPLPINSLELSFPAATSPVKTSSCTDLGTVGGSAWDSIAGLAYEFGDTSDGVSSVTGTPAAVNFAATPTAVTNQCVATPAVKNTATGSMHGLTSGKPTLTLKVKTGTAFGTVTVGLPHGLSFVKASKKVLAKEISGKAKSIRIAGGKLVVALKSSVTSVTITTKKGLIAESSALVKSVKKHKTKKLTVSVHAGSIALTASIKA